MRLRKIGSISYVVAISIVSIIILLWNVFRSYYVITGINNNCPTGSAANTFPGSYYGQTGYAPQPHIFSGSIAILITVIAVAVVMISIRQKSRRMRLIMSVGSIALLLLSFVVTTEILNHTYIPSTCIFNG